MLPKISIRSLTTRFSKLISSSQIQERAILNEYHSLDESGPALSSTGRSTLLGRTYFPFSNQKRCMPDVPLPGAPCIQCQVRFLLGQRRIFVSCGDLFPRLHVRHVSNSLVELKTDDDVVKFSFGTQTANGRIRRKEKKTPRHVKMSKRAKLNELRFYRLKAKKKMNSPNPEVRIRYKLGKAKRKEEWLIEKLRKFNVPKVPDEPHDPEILTEEEKFYLKRTGEKKKNYVPVGRRGVFGGVVLNMHLHWKNNETVKVVCKPCKPGQIHTYAEELARLSKGIVIDIKPNNTIIFFRGKNYIQPKVMSPPDTLSKAKALEKYKFEQSLEHTSQFIEKLEHELEEYHKHLARYKKGKNEALQDTPSVLNTHAAISKSRSTLMTVNIKNKIMKGPMLHLKSMEMLMYLKERVIWKPLYFRILLPVHRKYFWVLCRSPNDSILDARTLTQLFFCNILTLVFRRRQVISFPSPD